MPINEYEVELKVKNKRTSTERLVVITQHAYNVADAVSQSAFTLTSKLATDEELVTIMRVGPPERKILESLPMPLLHFQKRDD